MTEKNCFELLGIPKQASIDEIKKAYRTAAKTCHPDLHVGDKDAEKRFIEISEAYRTIMEHKRKKSERFSIKNIFVTPKKQPEEEGDSEPKRGTDIHSSINISFEESILGCKKTIKINRNKRCQCCKNDVADEYCSMCQGTGKVRKTTFIELTIPKGVQNGQSLKIRGKGNVGDNGAENGDLIIALNVSQNTRYAIKDNDLYIETHVSFPEAVLGTMKKIPTIYGDTEVDIPPNTQSGTKICLQLG